MSEKKETTVPVNRSSTKSAVDEAILRAIDDAIRSGGFREIRITRSDGDIFAVENKWFSDNYVIKESKRDINISGTQGDVMGVGVSGSGNIIGKNIVVGDGTINVSEQRLTRIQNNEYAESLKQFSENINNQLKGRQIPEEKVKSINQSINELAEEVKDVKPGKEEEEVDYVKQTNVEAKTATVIQKVLDVLPQAVETAATFTPLAPFSKLIGKGVQGIVDAIAKRKT